MLSWGFLFLLANWLRIKQIIIISAEFRVASGRWWFFLACFLSDRYTQCDSQGMWLLGSRVMVNCHKQICWLPSVARSCCRYKISHILYATVAVQLPFILPYLHLLLINGIFYFSLCIEKFHNLLILLMDLGQSPGYQQFKKGFRECNK